VRHPSGSKRKPLRNIELAIESRRGQVEQSRDRGRCFNVGDMAMTSFDAPVDRDTRRRSAVRLNNVH
jgi:hypothetical protein